MLPTNTFLFEPWSRVAPLGFRFWDVSTRSVVMDGLDVTATPQDQPMRVTNAKMSSAGIFGFARLPLVKNSLAFGKGDDIYWTGLTAADRRNYIITVTDLMERFLPCNFLAPAPARGVFDFGATALALPRMAGTVPLFSAVGRRAPADLGQAYVTLQLGGSPVKFAVVQVLQGATVLGTGLSDARGIAFVTFPYPDPVPATPLFDAPGVTGQRWNVNIRVTRNPGGVITFEELPDLGQVLNSNSVLSIPGVTDTTHIIKYATPIAVSS